MAGASSGGQSEGGAGATASGGDSSAAGSGGASDVAGSSGALGAAGSAGAGGGTTGPGAGGKMGLPTTSGGCGKLNPPSGNALTIQVQGKTGHYVLSLPANYNPMTAYPLGFGFHGHGQTGAQCQGGTCKGFQAAMKDVAVLVYPTTMSATGGWEAAGAGEREINVAYFAALLTAVEDAYCINPSRVFAAGTSSGASFTNILGCRFADKLLAVAPVDGYAPASMGETNCKGAVAAIVIHGYKDSHVPFPEGEKARDYYRAQDHCTSTAVPPVAQIHAMVMATVGTHGCSSYQGCDAGLPVMWCEHSEGGYDGTTHGWPKFGGQAIWDFVKGI